MTHKIIFSEIGQNMTGRPKSMMDSLKGKFCDSVTDEEDRQYFLGRLGPGPLCKSTEYENNRLVVRTKYLEEKCFNSVEKLVTASSIITYILILGNVIYFAILT